MNMKEHIYLYYWFGGKIPIAFKAGKIPYEKLSSYYTLQLQSQIACHGLTWVKVVKIIWQYYVKSPVKGYWYRFKHNVLGIPIIWYNGKNKGTYTMLGKPPTEKQRKNMVWTKHVLKRGKVTVTKC